MSKHGNFILKPMTDELDSIMDDFAYVGEGIETYPLCDYLMQSTLLRLTGFQEQKLKCILWDMATDDYEFRYKFLNEKYGECSNYNDKNKVFENMLNQMGCSKADSFLNFENNIKPSVVLFDEKLKNHSMREWYPRDYYEYQDFYNGLNNSFRKHKWGNLLPNEVKLTYTALIQHRNRIAHNTLSYQQNLPDLKVLYRETNPDSSTNKKFELRDPQYCRNYYVFFALLLLIDQIFITLYKEYGGGREDE